MVVVSREPDGRWYVTFAIDADAPEPLERDRARRRRRPRREGLRRDQSTGSGSPTRGTWSARPRNLARYQRRLARCQRGSANRAKAKAKVARAHRKVRDARLTSCTAPAPGWSATNDMIVIEDLNVGRHGPQPAPGPGHLRLRLGRVPPPA